jgi:EmrB/QacA subfamily drug resistance transporter
MPRARTKADAPTFTLSPELRRTSTIVVLGSIMSILDTTIVAVALPSLARDFHVSVTTIQWVATGYLLALALVTPVSGWAVDRFGAKRIWMMSTALFVIGSSLCGLAWSANSLIFFRVLQGFGGGMLLPVGQSILARAAGPQRMGRVMSIIGVPMVMGPIMGPVVGGLIVSNYSWRWIFYINVPIGIITLILSARWLPKFDTDERSTAPFDTLGFCLLSPGLALLLYALSEVGTTGSFTSTSVLLSFILGALLMIGFILRAVNAKHPLLDLHPFKNRNFTIGNICIFVIGAT